MGEVTGGMNIPGLDVAMRYAAPIARLLEELERLPGIGPKSAQRLAYHILRAETASGTRLAEAILEVKRVDPLLPAVLQLRRGGAVRDMLPIPSATRASICVVEEPRDVVAVERTGEFRGIYHVLQGAISPIDGIGPEQLRVRELLDRVGAGGIAEVVVATNPNVEGETTALYIARLIKPLGVRVTRIASGLPVGRRSWSTPTK